MVGTVSWLLPYMVAHYVRRGGSRPHLVPLFFDKNNVGNVNNNKTMITTINENLVYWIIGLVLWIFFQLFL
jgi:hypothetical protein